MDPRPERNRDAAGTGPYARERERLVPMSSLSDWTVSDGHVDVRGWEVKSVAGRQLGVVRDMLVDPESREVVLLDIDIPGTDQRTLAPIRVAEVDRKAGVIFMDSADVSPDESTRTREIPAHEVVVDRPRTLEGRPASDEAPLPRADQRSDPPIP